MNTHDNYLSDIDIYEVAELHYQLLHDGFLSSFGLDFLYLLYKNIYISRSSTLIIARDNGKVVGFVSGGIGLREVYFSLLRNPISLFYIIAPKLLNMKTLAGLRSLIFGRAETKIASNRPSAELYSICVSAEYQGSGLAINLYQQLCRYFEAQKVNEFIIVVGSQLQRARIFYEKQGALVIGLLNQGSGKQSIIFKCTLQV